MSSGNSFPWQEKISSCFADFDTFSMGLCYWQPIRLSSGQAFYYGFTVHLTAPNIYRGSTVNKKPYNQFAIWPHYLWDGHRKYCVPMYRTIKQQAFTTNGYSGDNAPHFATRGKDERAY